jgi:exocyst complex component 4
MRANDGRSQVLSDFLWTLYSKFEAIAEGHRVLHEVVSGIATRNGAAKMDKYTGGFKELWKLYQMEMRSILHDYLATDADSGGRSGLLNSTAADLFSRPNRDRSKRMFKLAEMDQKTLSVKSEEAELDEILKSSVPGLVSKSKGKDLDSTSDRAYENTSAGHKLLIEPGVFNMTILLPPSLTFLQRLRDVVPQSAQIPVSTLTSFLDDFLLNVFHPQLEEAVTELCAHAMIDLESFFEDPSWSKHSPHPIFKGTVAFMSLIRSFADMLSSIPQDQMFTQLIINQLVTYYDKCFGFYKAIVSRVVASPTNPNLNTLTLKWAAASAESGELHDVAQELLKAQAAHSSHTELFDKEVQLMLSATRSSPVTAYDIISDMKSVYQLSLLYNSMQWLSASLAQLRHVDATSKGGHSRNTSKAQNIKRWTLIKSLKSPNAAHGAHSAPSVHLPLGSESVVAFDTTLTSFRILALRALLTLHLDIRCNVIYQLSHVLRAPDLLNFPATATTPGAELNSPPSLQRIDSSALPPLSSNAYPFVLPGPPSSASASVLQLNSDLISFESNISTYLGIKERRFILFGLARLVDKAMVTYADNILVMNANGAEKMRVDAMVVQQNLRGILATVTKTDDSGQPSTADTKGLGISSDQISSTDDDALLTSTQQYYTLFLSGPDEIIKYIRTSKASGVPVGYTYDELRTLIELCYSEKLRGEDREDSVKARKKMGDVLLSLGEGMWDS